MTRIMEGSISIEVETETICNQSQNEDMFYNGKESILFVGRRKVFGVRGLIVIKSEEANQTGITMCRGKKTLGRNGSPLPLSVTLSLGTWLISFVALFAIYNYPILYICMCICLLACMFTISLPWMHPGGRIKGCTVPGT